jgi:hypothetical protein
MAVNSASVVMLVIAAALVVAIAAIVAVVLLVIKAFEAWKASTPEARLEAAKLEAEELNKTLAETKERVDAVREGFEKYKVAQDALAELTRGTDEWRQKLLESNNIVLDLIK